MVCNEKRYDEEARRGMSELCLGYSERELEIAMCVYEQTGVLLVPLALFPKEYKRKQYMKAYRAWRKLEKNSA